MISTTKVLDLTLYSRDRDITMDDVIINVEADEKKTANEFEKQGLGWRHGAACRFTLTVVNEDLAVHNAILKIYGDFFTIDEHVVKLDYRGCRATESKTKKFNSAAEEIAKYIEEHSESIIAGGLEAFNERIDLRIDKHNKEVLQRVGDVYENVNNFDFSMDDDPELLQEELKLQEKINELEEAKAAISELIRVNRIKCVIKEIETEADPRVVKEVKRRLDKPGAFKKARSLFLK